MKRAPYNTNPPETCTVEDCSRPHAARGYCKLHYARSRNGTPLDMPFQDKRRDPADVRFDRKWTVDPDTGCHIWQDHIVKGYGQFRIARGKQIGAHVYAYERANGAVPTGLVLDHICHPTDGGCPGGEACRHRRCVNPDHVQPETRGDNSRRCVPRHLRG